MSLSVKRHSQLLVTVRGRRHHQRCFRAESCVTRLHLSLAFSKNRSTRAAPTPTTLRETRVVEGRLQIRRVHWRQWGFRAESCVARLHLSLTFSMNRSTRAAEKELSSYTQRRRQSVMATQNTRQHPHLRRSALSPETEPSGTISEFRVRIHTRAVRLLCRSAVNVLLANSHANLI